MKQITKGLCAIYAFVFILFLVACTKGGSGNSSNNNSGTSLFPLKLNNSWQYKLKNYNLQTGAVIDSSYFTLSIVGQTTENGNTYFQFANGPDTTTLTLIAALNGTTLGTIDNEYGKSFPTFFVMGTGNNEESVSSWPVAINSNGGTCEGTNKLYAYYADTTLVNEDGIVYANSIKNIVETYDCSGNKLIANVYFVKQGVGLVRYVRYYYSAAGKIELALAWVLESENLN